MAALLCVHSLSHRYGRRLALPPVTFDLAAGTCMGVVGPNGAGKTTLLRVVAGLVQASSGHVEVAAGYACRYYGGEATLPPGAVARQWARAVGGVVVGERRRIGQLSRGTRQLLGLRGVLAGSLPALLLLDEPWEGLDLDATRWLTAEVARLKSAGCGLLVSSHRLDDLSNVSDSYLFLDGHLPRRVEASELVGRGGAGVLATFDRMRRGLE